ncbi:hypothetical protein [Streptomyces sp. DSM 40907]|uniref:hypothetical protein n=1 Tax=Streptomyces kutzneri TaxID=3051179 RepID=UPI0028D44909|nr:hypothetical protein [Streptomyces sp. DSM 40907]
MSDRGSEAASHALTGTARFENGEPEPDAREARSGLLLRTEVRAEVLDTHGCFLSGTLRLARTPADAGTAAPGPYGDGRRTAPEPRAGYQGA